MALEEADKILLQALEDIGFDSEEPCSSLAELNAGQVYEAVALCVRHIKPQLSDSVTAKMPASLTSRLNMCTLMANYCKELGFRGDLGYQTILYGSTKEIRNILAFLVDQFPKQEIVVPESCADPRTVLLRGMAVALTEALRQRRPDQQPRPERRRAPFRSQPISSDGSSFISLQPASAAMVVPSVLDWTARLAAGQLVRETVSLPNVTPSHARHEIVQAEERFVKLRQKLPVPTAAKAPAAAVPSCNSTHIEPELDAAPAPDREQERRDRQEQLLQQRQQELTEASARLEQSQRKLAKGTERFQRLAEQCEELEVSAAAVAATLGARRSELVLRRRARAALEAGGDAVSGGTALQRAQQRAAGRRADWTARRQLLERELRQLRRTAHAAPLQQLRLRETELRAELQQRERALTALQQQAAAVTKHVKRSAYTKRILEIVGSVKKQREGIMATIGDTRQLRKDINTTTDRIARSFQAAEELIFQDAGSSEWSRASYRGLVSLHDSCSELVNMVEQTAAIMRQARRLEETIDVERSKHVERNLEQVRADLENVQLENKHLRALRNAPAPPAQPEPRPPL